MKTERRRDGGTRATHPPHQIHETHQIVNPDRSALIPTAVFGTAHLFATVDDDRSLRLLEGAWDAGFRYFDTAPSYGYGRSEVEVARMVRRNRSTAVVTTKVGLTPARPDTRARSILKSVAGRLPTAMTDRIRGSRVPRGDFTMPGLAASVEDSLRRLTYIDRLMLHEIHPEDVTDELCARLSRWIQAGDVRAVGCATQSGLTAATISRASELLTSAHIDIGARATMPMLPASVNETVGHGVFGPAGRDRNALMSLLESRGILPFVDEAGHPTEIGKPAEVVRLLFGRASSVGIDRVIVASSRVEALAGTRRLAETTPALTPAQSQLLHDLLRRAR